MCEKLSKWDGMRWHGRAGESDSRERAREGARKGGRKGRATIRHAGKFDSRFVHATGRRRGAGGKGEWSGGRKVYVSKTPTRSD